MSVLESGSQFWNQDRSFGIMVLVLESGSWFWNRESSFGSRMASFGIGTTPVLESTEPVLESAAHQFWNRLSQFWNQPPTQFWNRGPSFGIEFWNQAAPPSFGIGPFWFWNRKSVLESVLFGFGIECQFWNRSFFGRG